MAGNRSSAEYGVPYVDQESVSNPETQMAANKFNRMGEDVAQMTRVAKKVDVVFTTSTATPDAAVTPTSVKTQWGTGSAYNPTITKVGTGEYVIEFAESYDDALVGTAADAASETETLGLTRAMAMVQGDSTSYARASASGNTILVYVRTSAHAKSDLSGAGVIWVTAE
ncbi:hypothetical protein WMF38_57405 [Sorangium sp. So ce118]